MVFLVGVLVLGMALFGPVARAQRPQLLLAGVLDLGSVGFSRWWLHRHPPIE